MRLEHGMGVFLKAGAVHRAFKIPAPAIILKKREEPLGCGLLYVS